MTEYDYVGVLFRPNGSTLPMAFPVSDAADAMMRAVFDSGEFNAMYVAERKRGTEEFIVTEFRFRTATNWIGKYRPQMNTGTVMYKDGTGLAPFRYTGKSQCLFKTSDNVPHDTISGTTHLIDQLYAHVATAQWN